MVIKKIYYFHSSYPLDDHEGTYRSIRLYIYYINTIIFVLYNCCHPLHRVHIIFSIRVYIVFSFIIIFFIHTIIILYCYFAAIYVWIYFYSRHLCSVRVIAEPNVIRLFRLFAVVNAHVEANPVIHVFVSNVAEVASTWCIECNVYLLTRLIYSHVNICNLRFSPIANEIQLWLYT